MAVLHTKEAATGIGSRTFGLGSYIVVGLIAVAIGVGAVAGYQAVVEGSEVSAAQQAAVLRGDEVGANLPGLWESGLAQQAAISEAAVLQGRFEAGFAQAAAIEQAVEIAARTQVGLIQQAAIQQQQLLQSRIEAGLAQLAAMDSYRAFQDAWKMRGAEMTAMYGTEGFSSAWSMRGEEMANHLDALTGSGLVQVAAMQSR